LTSVQGERRANPTWIPVANDAPQLADNIDGIAGGTWGDLMNIPMTAHFIGGCPIGDSRDTGVIDPYHRVYGYEGPAHRGRLSADRQPRRQPVAVDHRTAERAMALWPNAGDVDARPRSASRPAHRPDVPVHPIVPTERPAALTLDCHGQLPLPASCRSAASGDQLRMVGRAPFDGRRRKTVNDLGLWSLFGR